jgi:peptidyl-tRNA hydrolase, PTH1 family
MYLITGLGNPGKEYERTPHNAGFMFVERLKELLSFVPSIQVGDWENEEKLFSSHICKIKRDGELVAILQKPMRYMNNSGIAVKEIMKKFKVERFILVHDDLDISLGSYKIQDGKSPKGHNGVLSVESAIDTSNFLRVRLGIENRKDIQIPGEDYVLQKYKEEELETLNESITDSIFELKTTLEL